MNMSIKFVFTMKAVVDNSEIAELVDRTAVIVGCQTSYLVGDGHLASTPPGTAPFHV